MLIKRFFIIMTLVIIVCNCAGTQFNTIVQDENSDKKILLGYCNRQVFDMPEFNVWFNEEYNSYLPDNEVLYNLKEITKEFSVKIVMGTWCSDSRREVPRFYKILDAINFPANKVTLINVNRDKVGISDEVDGLDISFVPTFIISANEKEIGRIVETPEKSLEKDLLNIINQ